MTRQIRKYARDFIAIVVLALLAAGTAAYILSNERLRFPFFQSAPFKLKAQFSTAQAVIPGQGQTVRVSGVRIGDISSVSLKDGLATVTMDVDSEYKHLVHRDATALLRPKTGLKDMFIELNPGTDKAHEAPLGWTIPVANTLPDINPDEIFAALDQDTRDYLRLLVSGAGQGLKGNGTTLQALLSRFEPLHRDILRVSALVARRHTNLAHLIHSLRLLNDELATKGPEIRSVIKASDHVFTAIASQNQNLSRAVALLPGALHQTTDTLGKVQTFAGVLHPTAVALQPVAKALTRANRASTPFFRATTPILANQIRPFLRNAQPLLGQLISPAKNLSQAAPDLTTTFTVLNRLFNMLAYNPYGNAQYDSSKNGNYLFWLAWLGHNADYIFTNTDANGPLRSLTVASTCATLNSSSQNNPLFASVYAAVLANPAFCGPGAPGGPTQ